MNYLEGKEYQIDKENDELNKKNIKINEMITYNKNLEKELNEIKMKYNQLLSKFENNNNNIIKNDISIESSLDADAFIELLNKNKNDTIKNKYKINNQKNEENKQNGKKKGFIELNYIQPTLIGLDNIGATCFMNSTLQCLSQTEVLSNYFLNPNNKNRIINNNIAMVNINDHQLSPFFLELIENLWNKQNSKRSFSPYNIINKINEMNSLFKKGQPGDSKDFIIFILEQLHKELKKSVNKNNSLVNETALNQYDKINAFNHFFTEFQKDCSIISDIFFGFIETTNECLNCKNIYNNQGLMNPICYNYQIFNCIIFPLEEVKNMKNNLMQNNNIMPFNNNIVSIYECFYYNQKSDFFTGENRNYCNICKQLYDSIYTNKIFVGPNILVLILNRGKDNIYNVKLDFSETIDITQFIIQKEMPQIIYNLYGVITHIGQSGPNAHFVASCKSPVDKRWYRYNDSLVSQINDVQKEIIDFGTPYILFYQKNNNINNLIEKNLLNVESNKTRNELENAQLIQECNKIEKLNLELNNLQKIILEKENLIKLQKIKLEELKKNNKILSTEKEKLITVIFSSYDEIIIYSIICKKTDIFNEVEILLYEKYPEINNIYNKFYVNGKLVNKNKSLQDNNIINNEIIKFKI